MLKPLQTKNSKKNWFFLLIGMILVSTLFPIQSSATSCPTVTQSEVSFTLSEDSGSRVLSGTSFGMRDPQSEVITYSLDSGSDDSDYYGPFFRVRNKSSASTSGIQYAEVTYAGYGFDYETAPVFTNGRRGYKAKLYGYNSEPSCETTLEIIVYVTDAPERNTMSGNVTVSSRIFVGDTITADFSRIRDQEGINNLSIAWGRATCSSDMQGRWWPVRGVGRWSVRQRISSANSLSYQLTNSDINNRVKSVWGQYQTDSNYYKWVCKNIFYNDDDVIQTVPEPQNNAPSISYSPVFYNVVENSGSGTLPTDRSDRTPDMIDVDQDTISYSISVPEDTPSNVASTIRSVFRVRNTAPNPSSRESEQSFEISYNTSFNYETTPEFDDGRRGYEFDVKGCDPDGACATMTIIVEVENEVELDGVSGSVRITGDTNLGGTLTADFSNISDEEGGSHLEELRTSSAYAAPTWRRGACTASKGVGIFPLTDSLGLRYQDLDTSYTHTTSFNDAGHTISVWGIYLTEGNNWKWVCGQTSSVIRGPGLSTISLRTSHRTAPKGDYIEFTLSRTDYLTKYVSVKLYKREDWIVQVTTIHFINIFGVITESSTTHRDSHEDNSYFHVTIPANQNQQTFRVRVEHGTVGGTMKMSVVQGTGYYASSIPITLPITAGNARPSGKPTITGTPQVGEILTADASTIMDEDGISGSFSYTWWRVIDDRTDENAADTLQQISGATSSTYTISSEDTRSKIKVKVSYRDDNGYNHEVESALTAEVIPAANTIPHVTQIALQSPHEGFVDLGSSFIASAGDQLTIIAYMSHEVSGLSAQTGEAYMRLNIGGQTRTIDRSPFSGEETPDRLVFHYTLKAGDSGRVTFPRNGLFIGYGYDDHNVVVPNPSAVGINVNLDFPQTHLGTMMAPVSISVTDASANENTDSTIDFTVRLSRSSTNEITVGYTTEDVTATAGQDYTSKSGTLTFSSGQTSKTVQVPILDDMIMDDGETFKLKLSNPRPTGNAVLGDGEAIGTIENSDPQETQEPTEPKEPTGPPEPPPLPPITASFLNMPSEHNGSNTFTFELRFSEDVKGLSYRTLKGSAFTVTNGSIKNARRLSRPANQRWEISVQPSNNNSISVGLPPTGDCSASGAICHSDGRKLSNGRASSIQGPAGISVANANANENTDSTIDFTVRLSRSSASTITVNYATQDGTATAGQDYTSKSGALTFTAGQTSKTVSVSLLSDSVDEENETFTLRLSSPSNAFLADSTATGTIENSDPMPSAWLPRFGRTVGSQAVDAISSKMGAPKENRVVIGGVDMSMTEETKGANLQNIHQQFESSRGDWDGQRDEKNQSMTLKELAHGTSFNLSGKNEGGRTWSAWGQFTSDNFKGKEGDVNLEGKVTTGFLGVDSASGHWRGGVAVSSSKGEGSFRSLKNDSVGNKGEVESNLTSIYPYFGYEFDENKSIWGILGMGEGDVTLTQENRFTKADTSMRMGAVGAEGPILKQSEGETADVTLQADGMYLKMKSEKTTGMESSESNVTQLRLTLDSSKKFNVGEGVLTPSFQMGMRHDGGDAEEGMGLEAGGAVLYAAGGLTLEASLRKLVAHEESGHEEWGASAALHVDPGQSGRGLSLSVLPTWGEPSSGVNNLLSVEGPRQLGSDSFEAENRLEAEIGYGVFNPFKKLIGVLTPYFALSLGDTDRVTRTGTRWKISHNANLGLELSRTKGESKESNDKAIMLKGGFQW